MREKGMLGERARPFWDASRMWEFHRRGRPRRRESNLGMDLAPARNCWRRRLRGRRCRRRRQRGPRWRPCRRVGELQGDQGECLEEQLLGQIVEGISGVGEKDLSPGVRGPDRGEVRE